MRGIKLVDKHMPPYQFSALAKLEIKPLRRGIWVILKKYPSDFHIWVDGMTDFASFRMNLLKNQRVD